MGKIHFVGIYVTKYVPNLERELNRSKLGALLCYFSFDETCIKNMILFASDSLYPIINTEQT